jgi:hypothetical protein
MSNGLDLGKLLTKQKLKFKVVGTNKTFEEFDFTARILWAVFAKGKNKQ